MSHLLLLLTLLFSTSVFAEGIDLQMRSCKWLGSPPKKEEITGELFKASSGTEIKDWRQELKPEHRDYLFNYERQFQTEIIQLRILGKGNAGGSVYLVTSVEGSFTLKIYSQKKSLKNDLAAFEALREYKARHPEFPAEIPQTQSFGELGILMPYIPGITYLSLQNKYMYDRSLYPYTKIYSDILEHLERNLRNNFSLAYSNYDNLRYDIFKEDGSIINILLHPENLIVHKVTGQYWVIDPF